MFHADFSCVLPEIDNSPFIHTENMKNKIFWILAVLGLPSLAFAAAGEPLDLQARYGHYYTNYVINPDGTGSESREWSMTVLKESAVAYAKHMSVTYSTSVQKAEVLAAYTKKPDGRRIDVPKDNYQIEVNGGKDKNAPVFSDRTTLSVVFPEVAVGDTVVFSYRLTLSEPLFPNHFSTSETFYRQQAFDDVRVHVEYPTSLWAQYEARGMKNTLDTEKDGRKVLEWTYTNPTPVKSERRDYSVFDPEKEAGFAFSTFKSYADIAAAYGARALPKAAVNERIQHLADDIAKDKKTKRDQARALYDWVATKISYAGNCVGVGTVVPHDLSFILDNKMGDCKDHATLLQALLSARGIRSTQALVNASSIYRLPKIPVVSNVNHVINYLPDFDLYVDSTSETTPFGLLPYAVQDKPVLLVEGYREGVKTPSSRPEENQQRMKSMLKLAKDGSISGTIEVFEKGQGAAASRAMARDMTKDVEEDLVKNMFRSWGAIGSGKYEKDDPTELADTYHYKATINMEKFAKVPGSGAFYIYPLFHSSMPIQSILKASMDPEKEADVTCSNGSSTEEYVIELPTGMKVLSIPGDLKVSNDFLSYTASYKLKGKVLTVKRTLEDNTKGNVCAPEIFMAYKKLGEKIEDNLKEQVLYK